MKPIWKLLALGMSGIFLMQSCVTVRPARRHRHHRHGLVADLPVTDTTLSNLSTAQCPVASEFMVYGNKG